MLVVLVALLGWGITSALVWPGFQAKGVAVTGEAVVTPSDVRRAAAIPLEQNIWLLNPWAIRDRVTAIPYVATATLVRSWPNRVEILITERRPESCIRVIKGVIMTIDATQRVLEFGCKMPLLYDVPRLRTPRLGETLHDPELARLRAIAVIFSQAGMRLRRVALDRDDGALVTRRDGLLFLLGDDADLAAKVQLITPIVDAARMHGQSLEQIDLRSFETPVARYKETHRRTQNRAPKI